MSHLSQFRQTLLKEGFEAAIISNKANQRYLSDFDFDDGLVLVTADDAYLLTDFRYLEAAEAGCSKELQILTPEQGHLACIRGILEDKKAVRVAIEVSDLSYGTYQRFAE